MPFRIERFEENIKRSITGPAKSQLLQASQAYRGLASSEQKTLAIQSMMELLDRHVPRLTRQRLMESCGRQCISDNIVKKALRITNQAANDDDMFVRLNNAHIAGGHLYRVGDIIHAKYQRCYCGSVSRAKARFSATYCYCSCGWYRQLFETIFKKTIKVEIFGSIIQGDEFCRFNIHIK